MLTAVSGTRKPRNRRTPRFTAGCRRRRRAEREERHTAASAPPGPASVVDELHRRAGEFDDVAVAQRHRITRQRHAVDAGPADALDMRERVAVGTARDR